MLTGLVDLVLALDVDAVDQDVLHVNRDPVIDAVYQSLDAVAHPQVDVLSAKDPSVGKRAKSFYFTGYL